LDFAKQDRTAFKLVVFSDSMPKFPDTLEALYLDQLVEVRGTVSLYAGNPQMVVSTPDQIRVVDELPPVVLPKPIVPVDSERLRLATFNVLNLFDNKDDPYRDDDSTPAKPRTQLESLAALMREVNADVWALEEVENRGYLQRYLEVFLPDLGYRHVVHFEGNDNRGIDVCVVSRIPIGPVTSQRHREFPGPDGNPMSFQRDILQVVLEPRQGSPFEMWVVHLKSNSGGSEAAEPIRLAEARMLRRLLDERLSREADAKIVLCGDFNDVLESATITTIVGQGDYALQSMLGDLPPGEKITYNEEPYREMIDFIFCSRAMLQLYVPQSYRIRTGALDSNGSDHNPVFVDFNIGGK
jgi:endonuclease/exonuclease/phosphatase family metal-dependent hydrolase